MQLNLCTKCCSIRMVICWTVLTGVLFAGSLVLAFYGIPAIITILIHGQTRLVEGTDQWDRFTELPFALNFSIRFFNVTNADDVLTGSKPDLSETRPYTYKLNIKRENIRSDDSEEDSVTYSRKLTFDFDASGNNTENDKIRVINPLLMSLFQMTSVIERIAAVGCFDKILTPAGLDEIFLDTTVKELLWDGIKFAKANEEGLGVACGIIRNTLITRANKIRVIEVENNGTTEEYAKISILNFKTSNYLKESPDGIYTINRGIDNMTALGNVMRWNHDSKLRTFGHASATNNETCQTIRGTDATIFHPGIKENEDLWVYNTDICRTIKLGYVNSNETYKGITGIRFEASKRIFRPSTLLEENDCYCSKATTDETGTARCYLDGVFDLKPCIGAAILLSQPHFLNADAKYLNNTGQGLQPDHDKHGIYLLIEPNTGTPLEAMKRVQLNSVLKKQSFLSSLTPQEMHEGVFPILWLEEGVQLPQNLIDLLNDMYSTPVKIATACKYALIATFAALFTGCMFLIFRKSFCRNKHSI
ncbi:sensory neuron membrane protein 2-like [Anthonomus grandis grandis]|uniref:sensory neuron membrane protein 2-like n=1 Tax=Anthonomus grandis grandis TaxID=2921223 RepID=UPI00216561FF|nr:sensory neuron membrane protein 2-like [Anthonomus grandis grandis]